MEDDQGGVEVGSGQVGIEPRQAVAHHQRLVDHGGEGPAGEVVPHAGGPTGRLRPAPCPVAAPLGVGGVVSVGPRQDRLAEGRGPSAGGRPEQGVVGRDRPPPEHDDLLGPAGVDHGLLGGAAGGVVGGVEEGTDDAEPEPRRGGQPRLGGGAPEERLRDRQQDPGAVAGDAVGGHRRPVADAGQPDEGRIDQGPAGPSVGIGDEADAAGVAVEPGRRSPVIEAAHATSRVRVSRVVDEAHGARKRRRPWTFAVGTTPLSYPHVTARRCGAGLRRPPGAGRRTTRPGIP